MTRLQRLVIVTLVVLGAVAQAGVGTASDEAYVAVTNVTTTPQTPAPGAPVTVRVTIENGGDSPAPLTDTDVALRSASGFEGELEYARVDNLGTIPPGSSVEVPLTVTFAKPGVKQLRVRLWGRANGSFVKNQYPLTVRVADQHPGIDAEVNDTVAGLQGDGRIVVSNGLDSTIQNVELTLTDPTGTVEITDGRSVVAKLTSGERAATSFEYEADEPGTYEVIAQVRYTGPGNQRRVVNETFPVDIDPRRGNVTVAAEQAEGDSTDLLVDIINGQNVPIENVMIDGTATNASVSSRLIENISAESSRRIRINTSLEGQQAAIRVTVRYEVGETESKASDEVRIRTVPGQIDLTGVEIRREDGRLMISGSASNVGLKEANSVVVRVADTERVTPAAPAREYFVGTVPSSDFVSFEVYARTEGEVSSLPLEVTYLVGDETYTRTVRVPYNGPSTTRTPAPETSGGNLLPIALGSVLVAGVGAIVYVGWRNRRRGS